MTEADQVDRLTRFMAGLHDLVPHRFEVITQLGDGTRIPPEALSEDHTLGLYGEVIPRKMRESVEGYSSVDIGELRPTVSLRQTPTGVVAESLLEYPPLRGVRFRAERLQYLEEGWWATTGEVAWPLHSVLALAYAVRQQCGAVHLCLHRELPMPLWIRGVPLGESTCEVQAVVQARGEGRVLFTNIHSECTLAYAAQWAEAARGYYRLG